MRTETSQESRIDGKPAPRVVAECHDDGCSDYCSRCAATGYDHIDDCLQAPSPLNAADAKWHKSQGHDVRPVREEVRP